MPLSCIVKTHLLTYFPTWIALDTNRFCSHIFKHYSRIMWLSSLCLCIIYMFYSLLSYVWSPLDSSYGVVLNRLFITTQLLSWAFFLCSHVHINSSTILWVFCLLYSFLVQLFFLTTFGFLFLQFMVLYYSFC